MSEGLAIAASAVGGVLVTLALSLSASLAANPPENWRQPKRTLAAGVLAMMTLGGVLFAGGVIAIHSHEHRSTAQEQARVRVELPQTQIGPQDTLPRG